MSKTGLVISKFLPFHKGHQSLIDFAKSNCDKLQILICCERSESISSEIRFAWLERTYSSDKNIELHLIEYLDSELPNTSESSREVSKIWAEYLINRGFSPDIIFSSEKYGDYMAEYLKCSHQIFDEERKTINISATQIRENPHKNWEFICDSAKTYFLKKICLIGTESTGKSTLTVKLAEYFNSDFVPEMAREIVDHTKSVMYEDLCKIAKLHSQEIEKRSKSSKKGILFVDTDVNITKSYSRFLFNKELEVSNEIEELNKCDLYLFLTSDCEYIQDGTRLENSERLELERCHKSILLKSNINYIEITGNYDQKLEKCISIIKQKFRLN